MLSLIRVAVVMCVFIAIEALTERGGKKLPDGSFLFSVKEYSDGKVTFSHC